MFETNEAATSPASTETNSQETSTTSNETVGDNNTTEINNDPMGDTADSLGVKIDLKSLPEEARKYAEKVEKEFKAAYTRKTQEYATKSRTTEYEREQTKKEVARYQNMVREVLTDPSKADAYRQLYGFNAPKEEPKQFNTVEDLVQYQEQKIQNLEKTLEQKFERKMQDTLQYNEQVNKWDSALSGLKAADPKFAKYEGIVVKMLSEPKYQQMYRPGTEAQLLKQGYADFKAMLKDDLEEAKSAGIKAVAEKKGAATLVPKKNVTTTAPVPSSDKNDVIQRVRDRLGA